MADLSPNLILYPIFAMFFLVAFVLVLMARLRVGAVQRGDMNARFYRNDDEGEEPKELRVVTRHFINLFEMPLLFYVGVILVYITHQVNSGWSSAPGRTSVCATSTVMFISAPTTSLPAFVSTLRVTSCSSCCG